jgi:hypothetical protein
LKGVPPAIRPIANVDGTSPNAITLRYKKRALTDIVGNLASAPAALGAGAQG